MNTTWDDSFEDILRAHLGLLSQETPITPNLDMRDHGLDSLEVVSLLLDVEDEYDLSIPDDALSSTTFETPMALWSVIESLRSNGPLELH